jgi:hypothetical protein
MSAMTMEFDGVRELSMEEVDAVSGAALPLVPLAIVGRAVVQCAGSAVCRNAVRATVVVGAAAAGAVVGYENNRE